MITFTKEQLIASAHARIEFAEMMLAGELEPLKERTWSIELKLARIALASLEAEAVCVIDQSNLDYLKSGSDADVWPASRTEMGDVLLYRSAPPAPVSVPEWTNEQCLEFLSIAFRHAEIKGDLELDDIRLGVKMVNGSRAAMLQGADVSLTHEGKNHHEDKLAMVDHSGDSNNMVEPVTTACKLRDAVDTIRNSGIAIDGEKILAERDALNSPVIPDGWVAVPVEPTIAILDEFDSIIDYGAEDSKDAWSRLLAAAWIKSLPAAPQLEVK